jgi:FKBP-type peptidyl-prolyl cis-trans isomerase
MKLKTVIWFIGCAILFGSCQDGKTKRTDSGMKYRVYRDLNGRKPKAGDWVTLNMVYKDEDDSVLFDSRVQNRPLRFKLPQSKFPGSFEEGLLHIGEGDSATFFVNADSLFEHVISKEKNARVKSRPEKGSYMRFDVSLERVQDYREAEMEIALNESSQEKAEMKALEAYLQEKKIDVEMDPAGYYMDVLKTGKGEPVKAGDVVSLNYSGYFLNGAEFDSNRKSGKPYSFVVGSGTVIKGWDLAIRKLKAGDEVLLICPSRVAYGSEGLRQPNSMQFRIPPFSTLIFEIEVLETRPFTAR